jgi:hypothetical protein
MSAREGALVFLPLRERTMKKPKIEVPTAHIAEFCRRWRITEFALFGSVFRDDFNSESDVDVLVTFAQDAPWRLFDLGRMEDELERIFGRPVDLVSRRGLESSPNYLRREAILSSAEVVHVEG